MRKKTLFIAAVLMFFAGAIYAEKVKIDIFSTVLEGKPEKLGTVIAEDSEQGLVLKVNLKNIPKGEHGFHIHEFADCGFQGADGNTGAALAAGGHYDPDGTGKHLGPEGDGHKGDLPFLTADGKGNIKQTVIAPKLAVAEIKGRSIIIHYGGDNYSDDPKPLGGGGARIGCGIIK